MLGQRPTAQFHEVKLVGLRIWNASDVPSFRLMSGRMWHWRKMALELLKKLSGYE